MLNIFALTGGNFFINLIKDLTFMLDKGVYSLVQVAYSVFYYIADASILNDTFVQNFTNRMYTLLGIVMVFVLAFNLLSYIVDPDKITDKKTGASSFVKDVLIAIIIIAISPMLFTKLYALQGKIISSGVLENLILGGATSELGLSSDASTQDYIDRGGSSMVASVYVAFLYPESGDFTALDCKPAEVNDTSVNKEYSKYCNAYRMVKEGYGLNAFSPFIKNDDYNFTPFLTTVAGIVLLFFMLSFCINLAKRVGKMALVQLIAPVPVTLELLPNKKGLRDNWFKTLAKVYLEVFFYLLVMYFIMLLISLIPGTITKIFDFAADGIGPVKLLATVLLIYGLLMFGKEAPQMLFDLLGIKTTGVIKEAALRGVKMAGSVTAGLGTAATAFERNTLGAALAPENKGKRLEAFARGIPRGFTGAASGLARGMYMNRTGGFKNIGKTTSRSVAETLSAQRRHSAQITDAGKHFKEYADNIKNAPVGSKSKFIFDPIKEVAGHAIGESGVAKWARGSNYGAMNAELQSYGQYKSVFDSTKISTATDTRYQNFQEELDKLFATNRIDPNLFNARKKEYLKAHDGAKLSDFLASEEFEKEFGTAGIYASPEIQRISDAMDSREKAMKVAKKDDLSIALAQAKALIETNSDVAKIARDNGIDLSNLSTSSDDEAVITYDTLKKLNTKIGDRMTEIRTDIAAQEMREKNKNAGSSSSDKK